MKLIQDLVVWFVKLIYLILVAILATLTKLLLKILTIIKSHFNQNTERGKTLVKAYYFLEALENNLAETPEIANDIASSLFETWSDPDADNKILKRALAYAKHNHGGNQLPIIKCARAKGFTG